MINMLQMGHPSLVAVGPSPLQEGSPLKRPRSLQDVGQQPSTQKIRIDTTGNHKNSIEITPGGTQVAVDRQIPPTREIETKTKNLEKKSSFKKQNFTVDFSLLIIGAGPHALSLLAKLMEPSNDKLEEHPTNKTFFQRSSGSSRIRAKYKFTPDHIFTQKDKTIKKKWRAATSSKDQHEEYLKHVCIIDRNKKWLEQWKHQFDTLEIPNLRSGVPAHCDPVDVQGMRVYIENNGDHDSSVVKLKLNRSVAYRGPFEVPKTHIYNNFSDSIVSRYHLENSITQGTVEDVELVCSCNKKRDDDKRSKDESKDESSDESSDASSDSTTDESSDSSTKGGADDSDEFTDDSSEDNDDNNNNENGQQDHQRHFSVTYKSDDGCKHTVTASNVVFATGPLNTPVYPEFYNDLDQEEKHDIPDGKIFHSCQIMWAHEKGLHNIDEFENLLIIGGGLTAGHLATRAIRTCRRANKTMNQPKRHITLCSRGPIQSRQFDLDLPWMGRERTNHLASYWSVDDREKRLDILMNAKNGGSMTPEVLKELEKGKSSGFFTCLEDTNIEYAYYDEEVQKWVVQFEDADKPIFYDMIWCATGTQIDMKKGIFKNLSKYMEIIRNRLPNLTEDLRIRQDINAFILGQPAGLTLGPGSVNLMGGRAGAARVAKAINLTR